MESVYHIVPAGPKPWYVLVPVGLLLATVLVILAITAQAAQRARFVLSPAGLNLASDIYGRTIPLAQLRADSARVIDLRAEPSLRPTRRRFGSGLPGYAAGRFTLAGGGRALAYLTAWDRVVYIPTTKGYALLLSVTEPDALVVMLKRLKREA